MKNNAPKYASTLIKEELQTLREGQTFNWGRISRLLDLVDRNGYWREEASTFTAWLDNNAELLGVKRSMAWRYLSPGRFYDKQLRKDFPDLAKKPLEEVSDELSPENLELLSKIYRAAPEELYNRLAAKVLSGEAKRTELKTCWAAFRPVLEGKTARGRGVTPAKAPAIDNGINNERLTAAWIRNQLSSCDASWTQIKDLATHKVFMDISLPGGHRFDLVIVTRGKGSALLMHGVEILPLRFSVNHHTVAQLLSSAKKCDQMWIALPAAPEESFAAKIPKSIGIIAVDSDGIKPIRIPKREERAEATEELSRHLLELSIKG